MALDSRKVRTILSKELRETLRDRRTLFASIVLPVLLYPLLMLGMAQATTLLAQNIKQQRVRIGVANVNGCIALVERVQDLPNVSLVIFSTEDPRRQIETKQVDAVIRLEAGPDADAPAAVEFVFNGADEMSREAVDRLDRAVRGYRDDVVRARLRAENVDPAVLEPFKIAAQDSASSAERGGFFLGRLAAFMLIVMSAIGAFYPALDLAAGEKERGTIETLLVSPASRGEIVAGKFLAIFTISVVTALVNLASMTLTFSRLATALPLDRGKGMDLSFSVSAGQAAIIVAALLPLAALMSALAFAISAMARSFREGQNYLTPLVVIILLPANAAALPGVRLTSATALVPVLNVTLLVREALLGTANVWHALACLATTVALAVAALMFARSLFENEAVLLRDSGDLDWRFWRRPPGVAPSLAPWHGLLAFTVALTLFYYVGSLAQEWDLRAGLLITELLLVLGPAFAAVLVAGLRPLSGLALSLPKVGDAAAAFVVGLGAAALGVGANPLINRILPPPPEFVESAERLAPLLVPETFAQLLITLGVVALLPGICEEVLMRGLVQRSLLSRLRAPAAIGITALLFGVLHLSVYHFIWPAALGVVLGVVALRTGSTVNSMITHATHNGAIVVAGAVPVIREAAGLTAVRDTVQPGWWVAPVGAILMAAALGWIVRNRQ